MISSIANVAVQPSRFAFAARVVAASAPADNLAADRSGEVPATLGSSSAADSTGSSEANDSAMGASSASGDQLSLREQQLLARLRQIDRQVRAHEQAHLAAGAGLVRGGASYTYETGPDDKRYAVGGEVSIDVARASTPQETLVKARQIRAAALAPADPSAQDQNVAARATSMASEALAEISALQREAVAGQSEGDAGIPAGIQFYRGVEGASAAGAASAGGVDIYA